MNKLIDSRLTTVKRSRIPGAKARWQNVFSGCSLVLTLLSFLCSTPATSPAQIPLFEQIVGGDFSYKVQKGDSIISIAARFGVNTGVLEASNRLSSSLLLKVGHPLQIDNRHIVPNITSDGIVINIPQRMLFYFKERRLVRHFPVGLGRPDWPTPTGEFRIAAKEDELAPV